MTKEQKKTVRRALRQYGRRALGSCGDGRKWTAAIEETLDYYAEHDALHMKLLQWRYIDGMSENTVVAKLYIGRTTYYRKELEALSTVAIAAARRGLL